MNKRLFAAIMVLVMVLSCMPTVPVAASETNLAEASGTTYYVSSVHGAAGNNGTSEETPFNSLHEINKITLGPGDVVLLERGSVFQNEFLHVKGSGSAEEPIIIDVYGDETQPKPLIATNGYGVWKQDYGRQLDNANHVYRGDVSSCILLYDVEYIEIRNIAMTNEGNFAEGEVYNSAYRMDRTGVAGVAENIGTVDHIVLENLDITNVEGNVYNKHMCNGGIYFVCHQPDDESLTGISRYDDVQIIGCTLDNVNRWGIAVGYTAYHNKFPYANTIPDEICETYGSSNVYIANNYLKNTGGDAITTMYCFRPLIEYNVASGYAQDITDGIYDYEYNRGGQVAAGIWPWMCKAPVFQYNECYDSTYNQDGQAWDADWGDGCIYQYNYSSNNAGGAVMFCGTWACNTIFRYNISQNDLSGVLNLAGSPNGEIYNNVFYIKEGVKINRDNMSGGRGNSIYNNIFYYSGATPANATLGNWGDITADWSNNIYYNYAKIPADPYAITADPMFADVGTAPAGAQASGVVYDRSVFAGYKLQADSPAIDAGKAVNATGKIGLDAIEGVDSNQDFFGNKLDLRPDIGIFEAEHSKLISVSVGESVKVTDEIGVYSQEDISELDASVASVSMNYVSVSTKPVLGEAVTTLEDGDYIIVNNRANKPLTNAQAASQEGETATMSGLALAGTKENIVDAGIWTLTQVNGQYAVQDVNGKYLAIVENDANLISDATYVDIVYNTSDNTSGGYWTLNQNGYYLNDAANKSVCASGWKHSSASTDAGSKWTIYKVDNIDVKAKELTFTGVKPGNIEMKLGNIAYKVIVPGMITDKTNLPAAGGTITIKIFGTDLKDGISIKAGELSAITSGTTTEQTATLTIPANVVNEAVIYTVQYSLDGTTYIGNTAVTVEATESSVPDTNKPDPEPEETKPDASEPEYTVPECDKDDNCVLSQFEDIKVDDWYHDGIHFCVEQGIMNGMGEGKFAPNENTTRAQLVMMLYRLAGAPGIEGKTEPFSDVADTDWFYAPIVWAYENKVVNGVSDTEFAPNAGVTREQVATILHRYLGEPEGTGKLEEFPDVADVSAYAVAPLTWAVGEGLITGIAQADGTALLAPTGNATRAQIATILMRHLTK